MSILEASRGWSLGLVAFVVAGGGCQTILDAPDYQASSEHASEGVRDRLLTLLAPPNPDCVDCLEVSCGAALTECAESAGCLSYVSCLLTEPSPASAARCGGRLRPQPTDTALAHALNEGWRTCANSCDGGRDFRCAGNYTWPVPPSGSIRLTQTLSNLFDRTSPFSGAEVSVCPPLLECDQPLARATTDVQGRYSAELEIDRSPPSLAGFRGFRRVIAPEILPHRLVLNIPILTDRVENTRLLDMATTNALFSQVGVASEVNAILMQVFDCRGVGANGATVDLPEAARAHYVSANRLFTEDNGSTLASQEGSLGVTGLRSREYNVIGARDAEGRAVAEASVWVPGDDLVILGLYPSAQVEP